MAVIWSEEAALSFWSLVATIVKMAARVSGLWRCVETRVSSETRFVSYFADLDVKRFSLFCETSWLVLRVSLFIIRNKTARFAFFTTRFMKFLSSLEMSEFPTFPWFNYVFI
jgi:hypothetical protein